MIQKIKSNSFLIISVIVACLIILGAIYFSGNSSSSTSDTETKKVQRKQYADNVSLENGKQIIKIEAKGGYSPEHSTAKAGIPTVLRLDTDGTFDCSSIVRIPSMNISENLPMSGTTDIDIGIQKIGKFYGICGMGMYPFDVEFI